MKSLLTDTTVKNAKPKDKPYNLTDGGGLYLKVTTAGKYWRYNYSFNGKQKTYAMGVYPDTSLKQARDKHQAARESLAQGIDPSAKKQEDKGARRAESTNTQTIKDDVIVKTVQRPPLPPESTEYEGMINGFIVIGAMATTGGDAEEAARLPGVTVEFINERF